MASEPAQDLKTYRGSCHCGAFVYEAKIPEIKKGMDCNCSICVKKGYVWSFPGEANLTIVKGDEDTLKAYTFGPATLKHMFCPNCGIGVMGCRAGSPMKTGGVNLRTVQEDVDFSKVECQTQVIPFVYTQASSRLTRAISSYDGAALHGPYDVPVYDGPEPKADVPGGRIYHGSCHCGKVRLAVKTKPLEELDPTIDEDRIITCNCSICQRLAAIWIYPKRSQIEIQGEENLATYKMGTGSGRKSFCRDCGVFVLHDNWPYSAEEEKKIFDEDERKWREKNRDWAAISLRVLNGIDSAKYEKLARRIDLISREPKYDNP